jgi:hypothetical protein
MMPNAGAAADAGDEPGAGIKTETEEDDLEKVRPKKTREQDLDVHIARSKRKSDRR